MTKPVPPTCEELLEATWGDSFDLKVVERNFDDDWRHGVTAREVFHRYELLTVGSELYSALVLPYVAKDPARRGPQSCDYWHSRHTPGEPDLFLLQDRFVRTLLSFCFQRVKRGDLRTHPIKFWDTPGSKIVTLGGGSQSQNAAPHHPDSLSRGRGGGQRVRSTATPP